jgi:hypothetical protein
MLEHNRQVYLEQRKLISRLSPQRIERPDKSPSQDRSSHGSKSPISKIRGGTLSKINDAPKDNNIRKLVEEILLKVKSTAKARNNSFDVRTLLFKSALNPLPRKEEKRPPRPSMVNLVTEPTHVRNSRTFHTLATDKTYTDATFRPARHHPQLSSLQPSNKGTRNVTLDAKVIKNFVNERNVTTAMAKLKSIDIDMSNGYKHSGARTPTEIRPREELSKTMIAWNRANEPYRALIHEKLDQDSIMSEKKIATLGFMEKGRRSEMQKHDNGSLAIQNTKFSSKLSETVGKSLNEPGSKKHATMSIDDPYSEMRPNESMGGGSSTIFKVKKQTPKQQDINS